MATVIPIAQSLRFREIDGENPNFQNTFVSDEKFFNDRIFTYCQRFETSLTQKIQIKTNDNVNAITATAIESDLTETNLSVDLVREYDTDSDSVNDLFFYEFSVDMSSFTTQTYIKIEQDSTTWKSEPFYGDSELTQEILDGEVQKIECYNSDNAFQLDFSTGITFTVYIESIIKDYGTEGETSTYDNQDELTKLKETVQRILTFKSLYIPRYLAETIKLFSAMDNFVINGISYIRDDQPEISPIEGSNLVEYSMTLNDKEYLGVNTHDIGFTCTNEATEGEIMIMTEEDASGSTTFTIPAGYLIHTLTGTWTSGTTVTIKMGTTVGGSDLVIPFNLTSTLTATTSQIHMNVNRASDTDTYTTVTGGVATLDLQLIQNKEI